jgi:hypothetical protein
MVVGPYPAQRFKEAVVVLGAGHAVAAARLRWAPAASSRICQRQRWLVWAWSACPDQAHRPENARGGAFPGRQSLTPPANGVAAYEESLIETLLADLIQPPSPSRAVC